MGWAETAREERRARFGEYEPERYKVVVYDTFEQYRLRMMTAVLSNSMTVPELFLFCADYVLRNHRKLKHLRDPETGGQGMSPWAGRHSPAAFHLIRNQCHCL